MGMFNVGSLEHRGDLAGAVYRSLVSRIAEERELFLSGKKYQGPGKIWIDGSNFLINAKKSARFEEDDLSYRVAYGQYNRKSNPKRPHVLKESAVYWESFPGNAGRFVAYEKSDGGRKKLQVDEIGGRSARPLKSIGVWYWKDHRDGLNGQVYVLEGQPNCGMTRGQKDLMEKTGSAVIRREMVDCLAKELVKFTLEYQA